MEMLTLPLGDSFLYTYYTAAHYWTQVDVSSGLEEITHWTEPSNVPGAPIQHIRRLRAVELGRQYVLEWKAQPDGKERKRTRTLIVLVESPQSPGELQLSVPVHPLCLRCFKPAALKCSCCQAAYCKAECQISDWTMHKEICVEPLIYLATGYLQGTTHRAEIANGVFHSAGFSQKSTVLTKKQQDKLCRALRSYLEAGVFHVPTERDRPRGGDMGVSVFIHKGLYADPREVPRLAKLMLALDPGLAESPGGL